MSDIATLDGALDELRARVRGAVLEPGEPGEREVFNAMHPSSVRRSRCAAWAPPTSSPA